MRRKTILLDLCLLFLLTAALIKPLFKLKYAARWDSIESTFIADGRFLRDHWPHPQWQPLWYCGTRFDYIYPPAVRYGTALLSRIWIPAKAYHIYTALLYCLGIAGVYFLSRVASGSRGAAWVAAAGVALVSPVFPLIPWRSPYLAPWRLWILVGSGEGPHMCALALLPFALGFAWAALRHRRPAFLSCAALFAALVSLTNFYGATALAIFYPLLVWSLWIAHRDQHIWLRAAAIPVLAYGLSAFWLTPSYLRITIENLQYVSSRGNAWSLALLALAVVLYMAVSWRAASRRPERAYAVFLCGSLLILGLNVVGHFHFNFRAIGEPHRLIAELDMAIILAGAEVLRRLWARNTRVTRVLAIAILLIAASMARHYVRHAWELYPQDPDYRERLQYRISDWMSGHLPQARTFVAGSVRFWWNAWRDGAQVGGGSEQGLMNPRVMPANWEVLMGPNPELAVRWLVALGADAVVVSDKQSQEMYPDFTNSHKFAGVLPVLYDDHAGTVVYQVPRRYASLARVVDRKRLLGVPAIQQANLDSLRAYTAVVEEGPDAPTTTAWEGTDTLRLHARVGAGQSVLAQVTYDPAWHAYAEGKALPVHRDPGADFSLIDAAPGEHEIRFVFERPLENVLGWLLTGLSLGICAAMLLRGSTARSRQAPAVG
ncbi:MAG: hypothetical protein ABSH50_08450 [Bryobacteraceae bacterium]|jgi:hypothetical protein